MSLKSETMSKSRKDKIVAKVLQGANIQTEDESRSLRSFPLLQKCAFQINYLIYLCVR